MSIEVPKLLVRNSKSIFRYSIYSIRYAFRNSGFRIGIAHIAHVQYNSWMHSFFYFHFFACHDSIRKTKNVPAHRLTLSRKTEDRRRKYQFFGAASTCQTIINPKRYRTTESLNNDRFWEPWDIPTKTTLHLSIVPKISFRIYLRIILGNIVLHVVPENKSRYFPVFFHPENNSPESNIVWKTPKWVESNRLFVFNYSASK